MKIFLMLNFTWNIILQRFIFIRLFIVRIFFTRQIVRIIIRGIRLAVFTLRWLHFHCMIRTRFINFSFRLLLLRQISRAHHSISDLFCRSFRSFQFLSFIFKAMQKFVRSCDVFNLLSLNIIVRMLKPLLKQRDSTLTLPVSICLETLFVCNLVCFSTAHVLLSQEDLKTHDNENFSTWA